MVVTIIYHFALKVSSLSNFQRKDSGSVVDEYCAKHEAGNTFYTPQTLPLNKPGHVGMLTQILNHNFQIILRKQYLKGMSIGMTCKVLKYDKTWLRGRIFRIY